MSSYLQKITARSGLLASANTAGPKVIPAQLPASYPGEPLADPFENNEAVASETPLYPQQYTIPNPSKPTANVSASDIIQPIIQNITAAEGTKAAQAITPLKNIAAKSITQQTIKEENSNQIMITPAPAEPTARPSEIEIKKINPAKDAGNLYGTPAKQFEDTSNTPRPTKSQDILLDRMDTLMRPLLQPSAKESPMAETKPTQKLSIGKISVEVVIPAPAAKTTAAPMIKKTVVVVNNKPNFSTGGKLIFGIGQL